MIGFVEFVIYLSIYLGLIAVTFFILSFFSYNKKPKLLFGDDELPKISVMIPAYNEEESIARTLDSILAVDYPKEKLEIVFVDNNSTDNTLKLAQPYSKKGVKILQCKKQGKGHALNYALKHVSNEYLISMDADTFVHKDSLKKMIRFFKDPNVMCVCPAMTIYKPKTLLQRVQYMEYAMGLFLRKAFASLQSIHVTPGAFSAYRKSFFDKHGGYDVNNLTEDLEIALRIQSNHYVIENAVDAPVYTIAPVKFIELLKQRRRWYVGLIKNTWNYKKIIFNKKYGDLGMFVIPIAWINIGFSVFFTLYVFFDITKEVIQEIRFLNIVNFDFGSVFEINQYFIERWMFLFFTSPIVVFYIIFMLLVGASLIYASRKIGKIDGWKINLPLFFIFFSVLFGFWWIVSIVYTLFNRDVGWR